MQSPTQAESPDATILKNIFPDGGPAKRARNGDIDDTWKVLTYRYSLNLSQCKQCRDAFYKNRAASLQKRADGGTRVTLNFCKECTEGNIRMAASYYASFADKKQPSTTTSTTTTTNA